MWANLIVDGWQLPGMHVTARCVVSQFWNFLMQILANRLNINRRCYYNLQMTRVLKMEKMET